jgi:ABC-2 type transport system permease protein
VSPAILAAIVAVVLVLRLWRRWARRDRTAPGKPSWSDPFSSDVALVAAREMRERFRGRIFRVGTLFILAVVAAAIVIPTLNKEKSQPQRVGLVGTFSAQLRESVVSTAKSVGVTVDFVLETGAQQARSDLRSGRVSLAILDGRELVVNQPIRPTDGSAAAQIVFALAVNLGELEALQAAHLTPAQARELANARALPVKSLQPGTTRGTTNTTSLIGIILIFVMLSQYNTWILVGVMEEKSSRVIEVLLAAVRPIRLLTGKVLGIGLVALAQASVIVIFALLLAKSVGSDLLHGTAPMVLLSTLVWLILGYAFYCWVYAAGGSLVERQDQVQSLALPLSLPIIFGYVMALTAAASGNASPFFKVLGYLPPTAPFAMPVLVGLGEVAWWQFFISAAISVVCTVGVARLAAVIYRRAILRTGGRVKLRALLTRAGGNS